MPDFDHRPAMDFRESWGGLISSPLTMLPEVFYGAESHDVVDPLFGRIGIFDDWGFPESVGREVFNVDHIDGFGPITLIPY